MMNRIASVLSLLLTLTVVSSDARAAVIRVEKDGSGDYITLQAGLDAAQPGDTVRIGPGRYDTFSLKTFRTGGTLQVVGYVTTSNIVIEGTVRASVLIGPSSLTRELGGVTTIGIGIDKDVPGVSVRNLSIQSMEFGAATASNNSLFESVTVRDTGQSGLQIAGNDGAIVRDSFFSGHPFQAIWLVAQVPSRNVLIERCTIEASDVGIDVGTAPNVTVRDCSFDGNRVATQYWNGASGLVERCDFQNSEGIHLVAAFNTHVQLSGSVLGAGARTSIEIQSGSIEGAGNYVGGGLERTINVQGSNGYVSLSNGSILHGGGYTVQGDSGIDSGHTFLDLRNNYWGTSSATQIADWILDSNDFPGTSTIPVVFEPFLEQSVATETTTMGSLKALFADPR